MNQNKQKTARFKPGGIKYNETLQLIVVHLIFLFFNPNKSSSLGQFL